MPEGGYIQSYMILSHAIGAETFCTNWSDVLQHRFAGQSLCQEGIAHPQVFLLLF